MKRANVSSVYQRIIFALTVCLVLAGSLFSGGNAIAEDSQPLVVGGFDYYRGYQYSFTVGDFLQSVRDSIESSYPNVSYQSFTTVTPEGLEGVDVLMLAGAKSNTVRTYPLSEDEQAALLDYVKAGGCAILFPDNSSDYHNSPETNNSLIAPFGMEIEGTIYGKVIAYFTDPGGHPLTQGQYGPIYTMSQNYPGGLTNIGPYATTLATNPLGDALAVIEAGAISPGSGRVIVYTDINTYSDSAGFFQENKELLETTIEYCAEDIDIEVAIDIKPGSDPNCVNSNGKGSIPVAIFGSDDLDVEYIDPYSLTLGDGLQVRTVGKKGNLLAHYEDVNYDGYYDLVVQFEDIKGALPAGEESATLTGSLTDGTGIRGSDSICLVP